MISVMKGKKQLISDQIWTSRNSFAINSFQVRYAIVAKNITVNVEIKVIRVKSTLDQSDPNCTPCVYFVGSYIYSNKHRGAY